MKTKDTKELLEISDGSSNSRHRVYGIWSRRDFFLVHIYSKSEILESFPVHSRLCSYLHRYDQPLRAYLSDPEAW